MTDHQQFFFLVLFVNTEFFEKNDFFGLPYEDVKFFKQGELPMLDINGKMMIDAMTNGIQMYHPTGVYIVAGKKFLKYKR